jgi:hypothetical protein
LAVARCSSQPITSVSTDFYLNPTPCSPSFLTVTRYSGIVLGPVSLGGLHRAQRWPQFSPSETFSFQIATGDQEETERLCKAIFVAKDRHRHV